MILNYLLNCFYFLFMILSFGLIIGLIEQKTINYIYTVFGKTGILLSGIIGTPIHEIGHLVFAILFGHNIKDFKLFPKYKDIETGKLGYMAHSYNSKSFYQRLGNFFIGIGPMFSCSISILILMKILTPEVYVNILNTIRDTITNNHNFIEAFYNLIGSLITNFLNISTLSNIKTYIFLILAANISSHLSLSMSDIKNSLDGFVFTLIVIAITSIIIIIIPSIGIIAVNFFKIVNSFCLILFLFSFIFSLLNFLVSNLIWKLLS